MSFFCADISLLLRGRDTFCETISGWELNGRILKNFLPTACLHKKRPRAIRVGRDEKDRTSAHSDMAFGTRKHQRRYSTIPIISAHNACNVDHQCTRVLEFTYLIV